MRPSLRDRGQWLVARGVCEVLVPEVHWLVMAVTGTAIQFHFFAALPLPVSQAPNPAEIAG